MDNKLRLYEIIAGGEKYCFWINMDLISLVRRMREYKWFGDAETMLRCSSIESVRLTDAEYIDIPEGIDTEIVFI